MKTHAFQQVVRKKGKELYRNMPWRDEPTFYYVLVSEIMLQQTQVERVRVKYAAFIKAFPAIEDLANASLADVLCEWQGLGYNRRAKYLREAARQVEAHGRPDTIDALMMLPGVGRNTAGAIMNYVYQTATPYVETNIRTVFFYHYFADQDGDIADREILDLVEITLDHEHPREWFWALMDYGAWLKSLGQGRNSGSRHYKKQPPLNGSFRQMRGEIIRVLSQGDLTLEELTKRYDTDPRFARALERLESEGLIERRGPLVNLTKST